MSPMCGRSWEALRPAVRSVLSELPASRAGRRGLAAIGTGALLLCAAGLSFSEGRTSVQQLELIINSAQQNGQTDAQIAHGLADIELTERITESTLTRILSHGAGPRTKDVLQVLAEITAFHDPPPAERLTAGAPSPSEQTEILGRAREYAVGYIRQLPDLVCTRVTRRFDDDLDLVRSRLAIWGNLRLKDTSIGELSFVRGTESYVDQASPIGAARRSQEASGGLTTFGEFGSIIGTLFIGGRPPKTAWDHWQTLNGQRVAIFKYSVAAEDSRYLISYCCPAPKRPSDPLVPVVVQSAYIGEVSIVAGSGSILRITRRAVDLPRDFSTRRTDTVVDYGIVRIGSGSFLCPIRSVTLSESTYHISGLGTRHVRYLNDMRFLRYHRFGTESTFRPTGATGAGSTGTPVASTAPRPSEPDPWMEVQLPATQEQDDSPIKKPQAAPGAAGMGLTIRATTQLVEVPVIVRDKHGDPIHDLTRADFELYDNGRLQEVRLFSHEAASEPLVTVPPAESPAPFPLPGRRVFSNLDGPTAYPNNLKVILIDQMATEWPDLAYARQQIIQFLRQLPPGERVGIYALTGGSFNILRECTSVDISMANRLSLPKGTRTSPSGTASLQQADADFPLASWLEGTDKRFRKTQLKGTVNGFASPAQNESSLGALLAVARHLAGVPGRKSLIWVSAGFPLGDNDQLAAAIRVFNDANVAIYPVDAPGLRTGEPDATVQPARDPSADGARVFSQQFANSVSQSNTSAIYANQATMLELSAKTGGRAFLNANDITGAIRTAFDDPRDTYLLGFYPQTPNPDGQYHAIQVRLVSRSGLSLRYRRGYFAAPLSEDPKTRLRDALRSPIDATGISLSAELAPASGGYELHLTISLPALHLQPGDDRWKGRVQVETIQRDGNGDRLASLNETLVLQLKEETYEATMKSGFPYRRFFAPKDRVASVRVVVSDLNSGDVGSITIPLNAAAH